MSKPTKRQKMEAYQALLHAPTLEQKKQVMYQHQDVLLRKYGFFEESVGTVGMELMQRQGADTDAAMLHGLHMGLIDDARDKGVEAAFREFEQNPAARELLVAAPDEQGTVIAQVTYMEGKTRSHPLMNNNDRVELVAFPSLMEIRSAWGKEELVSIPWANFTNVEVGSQWRTGASSLIGTYITSNWFHDGVVIEFKDPVFNSEMAMFFRTRGEKNASKLSKQLAHRVYDYRRRMGNLGGPR